ncbi:hypothetical protein NARC_40101 [Candidatus Nitrosocosmicus arcticus]|uniref:Uncharacterized protein n=1 Tax=Candidatus Nitrosocosmicus arcticus TaxID=2035267 RepID=A0A557SX07_9ARCH|nr:hypothetical protein NARC_40101 [Candidatus Nitrosocosmicus arcticus]
MTIISNILSLLYINSNNKIEFYSLLGKIILLSMGQYLHHQKQTNLIKYIQDFLLASLVYG